MLLDAFIVEKTCAAQLPCQAELVGLTGQMCKASLLNNKCNFDALYLTLRMTYFEGLGKSGGTEDRIPWDCHTGIDSL